MRRSKYNLNALSHDTAMGLIARVLAHGVNLQEVLISSGPTLKFMTRGRQGSFI
jgi:ribonuclease H2 subunit A